MAFKLSRAAKDAASEIFRKTVAEIAQETDDGPVRNKLVTSILTRDYLDVQRHLEYEISCYARKGIRITDTKASTSLPLGMPESFLPVYREIFIAAIRQELGVIFANDGTFTGFCSDENEEAAMRRTRVMAIDEDIRFSKHELSRAEEKTKKALAEADAKLLSTLEDAKRLRVQADEMESGAYAAHASVVEETDNAKDATFGARSKKEIREDIANLEALQAEIRSLRRAKRLRKLTGDTSPSSPKKSRSSDSASEQ